MDIFSYRKSDLFLPPAARMDFHDGKAPPAEGKMTTPDLSKMTKGELLRFAAKRKIPIKKIMLKNEITTAIKREMKKVAAGRFVPLGNRLSRRGRKLCRPCRIQYHDPSLSSFLLEFELVGELSYNFWLHPQPLSN